MERMESIIHGDYTIFSPDDILRKLIEKPDDMVPSDFDEIKCTYNVVISTDRYKTPVKRTLIMIAAKFGLVHPLKLMLAHEKVRWLIDVSDQNRVNALIIAVVYCNTPQKLECVRLLLQYDIDIDAQDEWGQTCLMKALNNCKTGACSVECVELLLEYAPNLYIADEDGRSALRMPVIQECRDLLKLAMSS